MTKRIAVTWFLREKESIWNNGAAQNMVFLHRCLQRTGAEVIAVNAGHDVPPDDGLMLRDLGIEFARLADVEWRTVDLLIEGAGQIGPDLARRVHDCGGKVIGYKFGNAYVIDLERMLFDKPSGAIVNGTRYDEIWSTSQHLHTCGAMWEVVYRCPVRIVPHIWEPLFVEKAAREFTGGLEWGYKPRPGPKRVAVFEPNINVVKSCIVPLLACEVAHRKRPAAIGDVYLTNATKINEHLTFRTMSLSLDIAKAGKVSAEGRFNTPWFLAKHADVVVSHQWENDLNYLWYDVLHGRYPLVHNSPALPDGVGYYYDGFDCVDAGETLLEAIEEHDADADAYNRRAGAFLATVDGSAGQNVQAHKRAVESLTAVSKAA